MHNHSNVSMDNLKTIFSGYTIRCTTPSMTEVCISCAINDDLRKFQGVVFKIFRGLLETENPGNEDKVFIYCTTLSIIIDIMLKEKYLQLTRLKVKQINEIQKDLVENVKIRMLNEDYLNHKFVDWFKHVKDRL